ncbi:MAG TPA: sugar dehydrogenase complex small subunit [Rhodanobacteraceae bacterium]|nr:sugar dehydrogenase complex small subunit [Rhodanobacteraceae bacterium]
MNEVVESDVVDAGRRRVLAGMLTAYTASLIPWALAAPVASLNEGTFLALSAILVGQTALDAELGGRLHAALMTESPRFDADAQALLKLIDSEHVDPARLQATLDASHSPLAPLPRQIMRAWCLGLVGEGEAARCIAYENALNAVVVAEVLKPPTYAYGPYGSWSKPPPAKGDGGP